MDFIPPDNISEFPLRPAAARALLQQLATSHTERIEVVVVLKRVANDPAALVVTVMIH
ncbi:Uncharacterised protein [Serratia rubidaea]|uniref:Uncharacterized protein n=1 Tax=Serratia rubidaea TaxID=61652 RepID=A0A3S4H7L4_SERRU|nr:hypothetical protein [Serratia rubidaea]MBD8453350.1 hypothetical protein [Serratia rubidaea]QPR65515.1 hypothetical protein I6G83_09950 [Serratia rubidaea]CAI0883675.1 Uncharacterised protein [Serratia rubidaea]CAI1690381.1 Uncharacterised protein [Serratia rubidaea]VEA71690.1 Uncharacterised protein [Serratia rubidaea]